MKVELDLQLFIWKLATIFHSDIGKQSEEKSGKRNLEQRAITHEKVGQPWWKSNLIYNSSNGGFLPAFIQICENRVKKSPENEFLTKGNNSWKSRSTVTKVELDL